MKQIVLAVVTVASAFLFSQEVRAGSCYSGYSYRSSYYPPSYSYGYSGYYAPSYSYGSGYGYSPYSYTYSPAFWYNGGYFPAGSYAYYNGTYYRAGYSGIPYYGETYSTTSYEVQSPTLSINLPNLKITGGQLEVEVAPPNSSGSNPLPPLPGAGTTATPPKDNSQQLAAIAHSLKLLNEGVAQLSESHKVTAASVKSLDDRLKKLESQPKLPPMPPAPDTK